MSKINRPVLLVDLIKEEVNYYLSKPNDPSFLKTGEKVSWIRWNENGTFRELSPNIQVDTSLIMNPHFGDFFAWMTTTVTEIIEQNDSEIIFKTNNSLYKLEKVVSLPADKEEE